MIQQHRARHTQLRAARVAALAVILTAAVTAQDPQATPQDPVAVAALARTAEAEGKLARAAELFAAAAELQPTQLEWVLQEARCLGQLNRFDEALDALEAAGRRFPDAVQVPALTATTYHLKAEAMAAGGTRDPNVDFHFEEAARLAEATLRKYPANRTLRLLLAQSHLQLGNTEDALAAAEEAVRRFPQHPGGHILLGKVAYQKFTALQRQLAADKPKGKEYEVLIDLAKAARDQATAAYERAVILDPTRSLAVVQLGDIQGWVGNIEQALLRYQQALAQDAGAAVNHSWVAANADSDRRIALYRSASQKYRAQPNANAVAAATLDWWHAYALYQKQELTAAYVLFVAAVEANSTFHNSRCYAMLAAYWQGSHDNAELQAAAYAESGPRHFADHIRNYTNKDETVAILEYLATRAFNAKRLPRSRDINHVLAMVLDTAGHWNNYAFLCRETKQYEASLGGYNNALSLTPDSPQLLNDTAVILQYHFPTKQNLNRAHEYYTRAITQAQQVVDDDTANTKAKARARQAMADARRNLVVLGKRGG